MKTADANDILRTSGAAALRANFDGAKPYKNGKEGVGWRSFVTTAAELQCQEFPPLNYIIPGLIPEGLSLVVGKPKLGKSWLALDISIAVATGRHCLGDRSPAQGDVLYCALEDNRRRLQRRIDKLLSPFTQDWPKRLTLTNEWRRINQGGVDDLREWTASVSSPRLIILDTLASVQPINTTKGYAEDYAALTELHALANQSGIGIVVLHHTRKMEADDPLDTISGTLGLAGCADTSLVVARSNKGTTIYVRGRDIEEAEHAAVFDKASCRWSILGDASEVQASDTRRKIIGALERACGPLAPKDIAAAIGERDGTVRQRLISLVAGGEVVKMSRGEYCHPHHVPEPVTIITT